MKPKISKSASRWIKIICAGIFILFIQSSAYGLSAKQERRADSIIDLQIKTTLAEGVLPLQHPLITKLFYKNRNYQQAWSLRSPGKPLWETMLFFDCSIQYGLSKESYHPAELLYKNIPAFSNAADLEKSVRFEILLTDAMITFINHLHFGKLNAEYPHSVLENAKHPFADSVLTLALGSENFRQVIEAVQPDVKEYRQLQDYLRLITGQYIGDSYENTEFQVRQITANLERWRWDKPRPKLYAAANIPSYLLTFSNSGKEQQFRIITGNPLNPTPILSSSITQFTTATGTIIHRSENEMGNIAFLFPNAYNILMHDTPSKKLFQSAERAYTSGCIHLEDPNRFARLLLTADGASTSVLAGFDRSLAKGAGKTFKIKHPIPVYIRYITCSVLNGMLLSYADVYNRDWQLSEALLGTSRSLLAEMAEFTRRKESGFAVPEDLFSVKK